MKRMKSTGQCLLKFVKLFVSAFIGGFYTIDGGALIPFGQELFLRTCGALVVSQYSFVPVVRFFVEFGEFGASANHFFRAAETGGVAFKARFRRHDSRSAHNAGINEIPIAGVYPLTSRSQIHRTVFVYGHKQVVDFHQSPTVEKRISGVVLPLYNVRSGFVDISPHPVLLDGSYVSVVKTHPE